MTRLVIISDTHVSMQRRKVGLEQDRVHCKLRFLEHVVAGRPCGVGQRLLMSFLHYNQTDGSVMNEA
jgi:hypothetical protein